MTKHFFRCLSLTIFLGLITSFSLAMAQVSSVQLYSQSENSFNLSFPIQGNGHSDPINDPPDLAIGASNDRLITVTNRAITLYDTTILELADISKSVFEFEANDFAFDPRVIYDPHHDKFIIMYAIKNVIKKTSYWGIGVSSNGVPTQQSDFCFIRYNQQIFESQPSEVYGDLPSMSVDWDYNVLNLTTTMFDGSSSNIGALYTVIRVLDLDQVYQCQQEAGGFATKVVTDSGGQKALFLAVAQKYTKDNLTYFVSNRPDDWIPGENQSLIWTLPTTTTLSPLSVDILTLEYNHRNPPPIRQLGGANLISMPDSRITQAVFRDGTLWYTHMSRSLAGADASIWIYKYTKALNTLEIFRRESPSVDFSISGIAVNKLNIAIVGFNRSSSTEFISIRAAEYNKPSLAIRPGLAAYTGNSWGHYANNTLNPNGIDFWIAHHYPLANGTTGVWIAGTNLAIFKTFVPVVVK